MRSRKICVAVVLGALFVAVLGVAPAAAHVEVDPESAPRGSLSVLSFVVPNESDTAATVRLEVEFPTKPAILSAAVQPLPGWTSTIEKTSTSGVQAISRVIWTGGSFGPGQFQQFFVRVALPKKGKQVVFKALQTYSDGTIVRWIETPVRGAPEPEKPAPILELGRAEKEH